MDTICYMILYIDTKQYLTALFIYNIKCIIILLLLLLLLFLFGGVLSSHPGTYMKFSFITIYGSNGTLEPYMSLQSRSHVKASMVLTRTDHLFIHNYIRSLLNNIS